MLKKLFIPLLFCLLLPAISAPLEPTVAYLEKALYASIYSGNDRELYKHIEQLLLLHPDDPFATLCYSDPYKMVDLIGLDRALGLYRKVLQNITTSSSPHKNILSLHIQEKLESLLYDTQPQLAREITNSLAPIRTWTLLGPYNKYGAYDLHQEFPPENLLTADLLSKKGKTIELKNYNGVCYPARYLSIPKDTAMVAYALTSMSVTSPVKLRISSSATYKLFINGKHIINNRAANFKNTHIITIYDTKKITIMLKMIIDGTSQKFPDFRVLITDNNDAIVKTKPEAALYTHSFSYREKHDYPFAFYKNLEKTRPFYAHKNLGLYFDNLNSEQACFHYRKALQLRYDPVIDYFLAMALINRAPGPDSLLFNQGRAILQKLRTGHKLFVPVAFETIRATIQKKDFAKAIHLCKEVLSAAPFHSETLYQYALLLQQLHYVKEFDNILTIYKLRFPLSTYPLFVEAFHAKNRDRQQYITILQKLVKIRSTESAVRMLLREYTHRGEYKKAVLLALGKNHNQDYYPDLTDLFINMKDYKTARSLLFNEILKKDPPSAYYTLGLLNFFDKTDPVLYWKKMLNLDPASFSILDYLSFHNTGSASVFEKHITSKNRILNDLKKNSNPAYHSTILQKTRFFTIHKNSKTLYSGNRVFCEDIIYIHDKNGIEKWGDYKIPFNGTFVPLRFRVYKKNGDHTDSYDFQKVNRDIIVNIHSLEENSILHAAYIIESPLEPVKGSQFFYLSPRTIQDYYEPLHNFTLHIISPRECPLELFSSHSSSVKKSILANEIMYTLNIKKHDPVFKEKHSGPYFNDLPWYGFSSMRNPQDFVLWYNGLIQDKDSVRETVTPLKKDNLADTISAVYDYVARNIDLMHNVLYYPEESDSTLTNKSGTPEDKVILAKALLKKHGIEGYIAFARNKYLPQLNNHISPDIFTHILLMVPLNEKKAYWLDFSNKYYPAGFVTSAINNSEALVLVGNSHKKTIIEGMQISEKNNTFAITIDPKGNAYIAAQSLFSGSYSGIRRYFYNSIYQEDYAYYYFGNIFPLIDINRFSISQLKNFSLPFSLHATGTNPGFAIIGNNKLFFQPIVNKSAVYRYISSSQRNHSLIISTPINEKELYTYTVPLAYINHVVNFQRNIKSRYGSAFFVINKDKGSQKVTVKKQIAIPAMTISPLEYNEFLRFCLNMKDIEYMDLVLQAHDITPQGNSDH